MSSIDTFLTRHRNSRFFARRVVHSVTEPAHPPRTASLDAGLAPPLADWLSRGGIGELYTHQAESLARIRAGENVLVVSGTAGGKTLCYNLPVVERLLNEPEARALYLFPTKALARDQLAGLQRLAEETSLGDRIRANAYDGDTPSHHRRRIRDASNVLLTNPDMLHQGILPLHGKWARWLMNLRLVVIDEIHTYRGIFGTHVAQVLRRLRRVAAHYGNQLRFVGTSATIGNPAQLAERLIGEPVTVVDDDGAPRSVRHIMVWNPPPVGPDGLVRRSAVREAAALWSDMIREGLQSIVFARSRVETERIYRETVDRLGGPDAPEARRIRSYRGGYLAEDRRRIEADLFSGKLSGVVSTNALELGIDVGRLDACIVVGYPGTVASFRQQAGRVGRRGAPSLVVFMATNDPTDQYLATHPDWLLSRGAESAVIDRGNPYVLAAHLGCAAFELPLTGDDTQWFGEGVTDVMTVLGEVGQLREIDRRWFWSSTDYPAAATSLRTIGAETLALQVSTPGGVQAIGEIDSASAPWMVYPGGVYLHEGETYRVRAIDEATSTVRLERYESDYFTRPVLAIDFTRFETHETRPLGGGSESGYAAMTVTTRAEAFQRYRFDTGESLGAEPTQTPTVTLDTRGMYLALPADDFPAGDPRAAGLLEALRNLLATVLPLRVMCDRNDIMTVVTRAPLGRPAIVAYDRYLGGLGFCERGYDGLASILEACIDTVNECPCEDGCPSCVGLMGVAGSAEFQSAGDEPAEGPRPAAEKAAVVRLLRRLLGETPPAGDTKSP